MSKAAYIELIEVLKKFFKEQRKLLDLIIKNKLATITPKKVRAEFQIDKLAVFQGQKRRPLMVRLLYMDMKRLDKKELLMRFVNIEKYLDDIDTCFDFIHQSSSLFEVKGTNYFLRRDTDLASEFSKNMRTGMKQPYYRTKAYLANNHLLAMCIRNPDFYIRPILKKAKRLEKYGIDLSGNKTVRVALENRARASTKIDDLYLTLQLPNFKLNFNGITIDLTEELAFVRVTTDSKFFKDAYRIADDKKLFQQYAILIGDRVNQIGDILLKLKTYKNLTNDDIVQIIDDLIPFMFMHYVVIPKDKNITDHVKAKYVKDIQEAITYHIKDIFKLMPDDIKNNTELRTKILEALDRHIIDHFGSGDFVLKHEISYNDLTPQIKKSTNP